MQSSSKYQAFWVVSDLKGVVISVSMVMAMGKNEIDEMRPYRWAALL